MTPVQQIKYVGSALPGNAETVVLYDTTVACPGAKTHQMYGYGRFILSLVNDQAGTLNLYFYDSDRATKTKVYTTAVAASAANSSNPFDLRVEEFPDFRVEWVNGATPQGTFKPNMALHKGGVPSV